jgi:hypothetical protein
MSKRREQSVEASAHDVRSARLSSALRVNLLRRKKQAAARSRDGAGAPCGEERLETGEADEPRPQPQPPHDSAEIVREKAG